MGLVARRPVMQPRTTHVTRSHSDTSRRFQFGPYLLDTGRRLLWRERELVPLTRKTLEVLCFLVERPGQVVEKTELLTSVWPDAFVEENNLARHISILRKAFHQRGDQQSIIATIPGHGYMFVAPMIELPEIDEETAPKDIAPENVAPENIAPEGIVPQVAARAPAALVARHEPTAPPALARPRGRPRLALVVLAFVGLSAVVPGSLVMRRDQATPAARLPEPLTFESALQVDPVWSPDGSSLVYASDRAGNLDLYRRTLGDPTPVPLTSDPGHESQADWSPDGHWLVFRSDTNGGGIDIMPASGGSARRLTDFGFHPRWSADGTKVLFTDSILESHRSGFFVIAPDGHQLRPVRPDLLARRRSAHVAWHPDGRRVSIAGETDAGWRFVTASLDEAETVTSVMPVDVANRLRNRELTLGQFVWSNTGRDLFFEGQTKGAHALWHVAVDPATLAWTTEPALVYSGPGRYSGLALSRDGGRLAFTVSHERTRVWRFPFDPSAGVLTGPGPPVSPGTGSERLRSRPAPAEVVPDDWSADGNWILAACRRDRRQTWGTCLVPESGNIEAIRQVDPETGRPMGDLFRVTSFNGTGQSMPRVLTTLEMAASANQLFVPVTEMSGSIWMLTGLDR